MRATPSLLLFVFLMVTGITSAQNTRKIYFEKDKSLIYFFQIGQESDSLSKGKNDRFLLLVPDSLKAHIRIDTDNAKLETTANDSVVALIHLPGLRYEASFSRPPSPIGSPLEKEVLKVFVNGVAQIEQKTIRVQFVDRRNNKVLLENLFYAK